MSQHHTTIIQDPEFEYPFSAQDFDLQYWMDKPETQTLAGGRNASCRFEVNGRILVLREYRRGGMMASLLHDRYLWTGLDNSRPLLESRAIDHALNAGLPVAPWVAYCIHRQGFFYRAAVISEFIENRGTLAEVLANQVLSESAWQRLGTVIHMMHNSGIDHADLNANNILLDRNDQFYLIDFDKAQIHRQPGSWQQGNLERLLRSLNKIQTQRQALSEAFHFKSADWHSLLSSYK